MAAGLSVTYLYRSAVFCWIVTCVGSFPNGAPVNACTTMMPDHPGLPQPAYPPYQVTTGESRYNKAVPLTVTINRGVIRGFIIQAKGAISTAPIGTWIDKPGLAQPITCSLKNDTVTHYNRFDKSDISLQWLPPTEPVGDVEFVMTIVHEYYTYWTDIRSPTISPGSSYYASTESQSTRTPALVVTPGQVATTLPSDWDTGGLLAWEWALIAIACMLVLIAVTCGISWCCVKLCRNSPRKHYYEDKVNHSDLKLNHSDLRDSMTSRISPASFAEAYPWRYLPYQTAYTSTPPHSHRYY